MFTRTRDDNWIYKWQLLNHMQGVVLVLLTPRWFTCFNVKSIFVLLLLLFCSICAQSSFVTRETLMRICRVKWETQSNTSHSAGNITLAVFFAFRDWKLPCRGSVFCRSVKAQNLFWISRKKREGGVAALLLCQTVIHETASHSLAIQLLLLLLNRCTFIEVRLKKKKIKWKKNINSLASHLWHPITNKTSLCHRLSLPAGKDQTNII